MYDLKEFKNKFDPVLEEFLENRINEFSQNTSDAFIKDLAMYSKKLALSGGKRLRPYVAYIMYSAMSGKDTENAIKLFVSLEIFHTFALIHDDIMDKANLRHGVATLQVYTLNKLKKEKRQGDLINVSNAQAILVGDLLFSWAMEIFLGNKNFESANITKALEYFYKMVDEVCLGQMIDIDLTTREAVSENLIEEKTRLKTSRYSFVRPMEIGASLANPDYGMEAFCEALGTKLGIAFQLQDDLLDIIGDPNILTKSILRDIADKQHTFFSNFVLKNGSETQQNKLKNTLGKQIEEVNQKEIQEIFYSSGAIKAGEKIIHENLSEAKKIIEDSSLGQTYKNSCLELVEIMEQRKS